MVHYEQVFTSLGRTSSCDSTKNIIPCDYQRSTSTKYCDPFMNKSIIQKNQDTGSPISFQLTKHSRNGVSSFLKSFLNIFSVSTILPTCMWLNFSNNQLAISPSIGRKFTGTLFGKRRGPVSFAIQDNSMSGPVLLIEFAISTSSLVKCMSSGLVRIALECEKAPLGNRRVRLFKEPRWSMYCNGRKYGQALSRTCTDSDLHVLRSVQNMTVGAGVIPMVDDGPKNSESEGELLYMRGRFDRVVGNRDSEAFYMMNLDGSGGPELSIFLLRI